MTFPSRQEIVDAVAVPIPRAETVGRTAKRRTKSRRGDTVEAVHATVNIVEDASKPVTSDSFRSAARTHFGAQPET
jgi:hypothetical protein